MYDNVAPKVCDGQDKLSASSKTRGENYPCEGLCKPLFSDNRPQASEWYCEKCNASYNMTADEYAVLHNRGKR